MAEDAEQTEILFFLNLFKNFFLMGTILKIFIEFVTVLLLFYGLVFWPRGLWDGSYLPDWGSSPHPLCWKAKSLTTVQSGSSRRNKHSYRSVNLELLEIMPNRWCSGSGQKAYSKCNI